MTRREIEDILRYHDQDLLMIDEQLRNERAELEHDLRDIRSNTYPGATSYAARVSSSHDSDRRMVQITDVLVRRENRSQRNLEALEMRRRRIESVYEHVLGLDTKSRCVLLALYYPVRTYEEAAELLDCDRSSIIRRRKAAIALLVKSLQKSESPRI